MSTRLNYIPLSNNANDAVVAVGDQVDVRELSGSTNLAIVHKVNTILIAGEELITGIEIVVVERTSDKIIFKKSLKLDSGLLKIIEKLRNTAGKELATLFTTNNLHKDEIVVKHTIAKLDNKSEFFIEEISFGENMFNIASDADEPCEYCAEHGTMVCPDCITQDEQDSIR